MFKRLLMAVLLVSAFTTRRATAATPQCPQSTILEGILKTNVDKDGYVDYDAIRINRGGDLYQYISLIETADLTTCSESDKLAFWINAYNAHMIRLVLARPNLKQISEDFKLFGERFKVAKINTTLNEIEHRIIRASTKKGGPIEGMSIKELEPRIHFALTCGALGSPKLQNHAFLGATLSATLDAAAVAFANDPRHVRVESDKLIMSSLMRWYEEDFAKLGGVVAYLSPKITAPDVVAKMKTDFPTATKFEFDWTLNSVKNKPAPPAEKK